ncbi:hypothetical protein TTHERM_000340029 (macronuclear) [Tetrahymena thermophila SB210]|uniref:Uncharacterized protein n=1 Tax=Tetrahymena thermophila (strain SB210) TaxID=312017 RepID=W7X404_TETTS|nr:hypothetical protein TTHERM_000340029 [Tetrahymena thermophila SB210]EWS74045.1 hypothetical protein TTHERM_000340029 [Tetrahymena thermophila SB210]|eukprot:XP_012653444.1 hypothetical protein TTHERM_000340029 [Tetrahymena thermophila SB210]
MCKKLQSLTLDIRQNQLLCFKQIKIQYKIQSSCFLEFPASLIQLQNSIARLKKVRFLAFFLIRQMEVAEFNYYKYIQTFKNKLPRLVQYLHDSLESIDFPNQNDNED